MNNQAEDLEIQYRDNEKLIYYVLNRYFPWYIHDEDIEQAARLALWKACLFFDESKGYAFSTYACRLIYNELRHEDYLRRAPARQVPVVSLQERIRDEGRGYTREDRIAGQKDVGFVDLEGMFGGLSERNRRIFLLWVSGRTQQEIADTYGISTTRVGEIIRSVRKRVQDYV